MEGERKTLDVNMTTDTLEPDVELGGGLCLPDKDRVLYRPPERKSVLGLDVLAIKKRGADNVFKLPPDRALSTISSIEEDESNTSLVEADASGSPPGERGHTSRRYRSAGSNTPLSLESTRTREDRYTPSSRDKDDISRRESSTPRSSSSHRTLDRYDRSDRGSRQGDYSSDRSTRQGDYNDYRSSRQGDYNDRSHNYKRCDERERSSSVVYPSKRTRYNSKRLGNSEWDDGRSEWGETPRRNNYRDNRPPSSRGNDPSPSPMLAAASPDARFVSPWLGGHTPRSSPSPWDSVSPSPAPIRASGSSKGPSNLHNSGRSHQLSFSSATASKIEWRRLICPTSILLPMEFEPMTYG